ncbi:MAG TPA: hypothetical protein VD927_19350 [Chryseosolibacter sp.]|nr:hypothetical protein [Chryseosolibacter sp.]
MKSLVPFLFAIALSLNLSAQHTPHTLKEAKMLTELLNRTSYFDSVLIIDKASYWDDLHIRGLGFKGKSVFKVAISFKETASNDLEVKKLTKKKVRNPASVKTLLDQRYVSIAQLSDDSLNLKPPRLTVTDHEIWTVMMINNKAKSQTLKQSYAPLLYQRTIPTKQRREFIEFVEKIEAEL